MRASEIIEQIKVLPTPEKERVFAFVAAAVSSESKDSTPGVIDPAAFERAADRVFQKHHDLLRMLAQ